MRSKWIVMVLVTVCAVLFVASVAMAQFLICVSEPQMKGEKSIKACSKEGAKFAFIGKDGLARILTPEELELTFQFNPKIAEMPAYGLQYGGKAKIPALPPIGDQ